MYTAHVHACRDLSADGHIEERGREGEGEREGEGGRGGKRGGGRERGGRERWREVPNCCI